MGSRLAARDAKPSLASSLSARYNQTANRDE